MSREGMAETWRERLDDFVQSEMSVQDWCDFNRVSTYQFYYWRRKIAGAGAAKSGNPTSSPSQMRPWLAVNVVDPTAAPGGVTVRIAGAAIELQPDFNPALLRAVVRALAAGPC